MPVGHSTPVSFPVAAFTGRLAGMAADYIARDSGADMLLAKLLLGLPMDVLLL